MNEKQKACKVLVLISGRGSNMAALLKTQGSYFVEAVLSDRAEAPGLAIAAEAKVPVVESFSRTDYPTKHQQKLAIYSRVRALNPELICLAGFMQILESDFVDEFYGRIINIHPSLLPNLPGLDTHRRALESNFAVHGCSVHFVDGGMDTGPLIAQCRVEVQPCETEGVLAERVLAREHMVYPWVCEQIAKGAIRLDRSSAADRGRVSFAPEAVAESNRLGIHLCR